MKTELLDQAAELVKTYFRDSPHHEKVFSCNLGKEARSLVEIAEAAMQRQFEAPGFIARLAEYSAANGASKAAQAVAAQMKTMILESLLKM
jgi:hypothetical protein